jgi:histone deacetylase 11
LYVDLDAHQGNGVEITLEKEIDKGSLVVFDVYGGNNYPLDYNSQNIRGKIKYNFPLKVSHFGNGTNDEEYLAIVQENLPNAIEQEKPHLIFYNAGTDIYKDDALGGMQITAKGIKQRDAFVFAQAKAHNIPIVMTLSGGYSPASASIIGKSIENIIVNIMK